MSTLRRNKLFHIVSASATLLCLLIASFAYAQSQDEVPARVGRVADYSGNLFLAPEERATEWAPIGLNYPITTGDNLWIQGDGRTEIDFGTAQLRLAGDSNVHMSRLDEREFSLFLAQGRAIVRIRSLENGEEARIDTPNTQVTFTRPGLYRVDVSSDRQETTIVVREGEAIANVASGTQQILPGQTATLFGATDVQADVRNGTGIDGFDAWSASRERQHVRGTSASYVSTNMVGAADLDAYGSWQTYPDYGAVWFPTTVTVGWAPYRYGRWVSLPTWGWTWVDDAPWGYAPFHYGRWAYIGGRWGWCPGAYVPRPVWAPALVAWYGGSNWGVSASGGPVYGWVPLGWRDPYIPHWRNCGSRCWASYNRPYAVNMAERPHQPPTYYANHNVPGAITAVPSAALAGGKPVAPNIVNWPSRGGTPPVLAGAPQLKPLPVTANIARPGNGVPAPASTFMVRTKPMQVPSDRANAVPPSNYGSSGRYAAPDQSGVTSVPPAASRAAPAYNSAEPPARYSRPAPAAVPPQPAAPLSARPAPNAVPSSPAAPLSARSAASAAEAPAVVRPAPTAVPPASANVTSAPPARYRPPQNAEVSAPPAGNRGDAGSRPLPRTMQPQAAPMPQPQPQAVQARPAPPPAPAAPPASAGPSHQHGNSPHGDKPAGTKPAPAGNQN